MAPSRPGESREFAEAVAALSGASLPAAIDLETLPAPVNLAPHAHAIGGAVVVVSAASADGEEDLATGRLVLLHRPGGHEEWRGAWRFVALVEADLEAEIAEDPLLAEVGWSWLLESLAEHGAHYIAEGGTVSPAVEVRASWTPVPAPDGRGGGSSGSGIDFAAHLAAWCGLMMMCAGLPPEYEGVANLPPAGSRR
ncbi:MAG: hypothetical protein AUG49_12995 [Catenulispora sp. 13_1_20CM_3_70_7]|nr:MAG: hypothetical protein AUG49_12995 [Catenulispora sp. 13_1_20CM_3_70_7]